MNRERRRPLVLKEEECGSWRKDYMVWILGNKAFRHQPRCQHSTNLKATSGHTKRRDLSVPISSERTAPLNEIRRAMNACPHRTTHQPLLSRPKTRNRELERTTNTLPAILSFALAVVCKTPESAQSTYSLQLSSYFQPYCSLSTRMSCFALHLPRSFANMWHSGPYLSHHASPAVPIFFAYIFFICLSSLIHASVTDPGVCP